MKKLASIAGSILVCSVLCGCIDSATVMTVNPDGSGTIVETMYMSAAFEQMMQGMAAGMGGGAPAESPLKHNLDPEQYKKRVPEMGEGVTFDSVKEVKKADGSKGTEAKFLFKDVTKLHLSTEAKGPENESTPQQQPAKKASTVTFGFTKGATPTLVINMPKPKAEQQAPGADGVPARDTGKTMSEEEMAQMQQMFDGFRFRMQVKVAGAITKSNATYTEAGPDGKKQVITLLDMDIGKIMKDEAARKKFFAMGKIDDVDTARAKLKDMPGLKMETVEKIEVSFK